MKKFLIIFAAFSFGLIINPAWAQEHETFGTGVLEDPASLFDPEKRGFAFLMAIIGIAIYALFVWYFYRFISKRDLFPRIFYGISYRKEGEERSIAKIIGFSALYFVAFPVIIFAWFMVLAFFVFFIGEDMPFHIALFVSMAVIGVVRILSYYREDAAKEVAKNVPYAILGFLLTSAAVYANPSFFTEKHFSTIPQQFMDNFEGIISSMILIVVFEFSFRIAFIIKRRFLPVAEKKLESEIESEIDERLKIHYKKIVDEENNLRKQLEERKLEFTKLKEEHKKILEELKQKEN